MPPPIASGTPIGGDSNSEWPGTADGVPSGGEAITALALTPFALIPPFSPTTFDYYVRCGPGQNPATLTTTDSLGVHSSSIDLIEDQALVVDGTYWVRCLPPDFPTITVDAHPEVGAPTPGYYLVNGSTYAMVLDTNGTPVWYARGPSVIDLDAPAPNVLSLSPNDTIPYGWSNAVRFDVHALARLTTTSVAAVGSPTDAHELRLLPNGHYLLFSYVTRNDVDLTGLGSLGAHENIADCVAQEIDAQENLVWSWAASDHVDPIRESLELLESIVNGEDVVDPFHCNSIDVDDGGNLLLSLRHANAVYYVDRASGQVEWKLGGTPYNKDGAPYIAVTADPEGTFSMQHDARFAASGGVTLFDDHGATAGVARAVEYAIDHEAATASFVWQFPGTAPSAAEGSFRREADGHSVIGWGNHQGDTRVLTEIDANDHDVLDVSLSGQVSYRAIKVPLTQLDIGLLRVTAAK
jgi:hypothetical protein